MNGTQPPPLPACLQAWVRGLEVTAASTVDAQRCIKAHLARRSPQRWIDSIVMAHEGARPMAIAPAFCAGCGKEGIGLRK